VHRKSICVVLGNVSSQRDWEELALEERERDEGKAKSTTI